VPQDRTVRIWNAADGAGASVLRGHDKGVMSVDFSPDGRQVATAGVDGRSGLVTAHGDGTVRRWRCEA